ncbi:MAG: hypothetical protein WBZ48_15025 [Bacteroidota bacterium]
MLILATAILCIIPPQLTAQPAPSRSTIKIVLLRGGSSGLSAGETESILVSLKEKLSQFDALTVSFKADIAKGLSKEDKAALDKCSDLTCLRPLAGKAGFQRLLLCRITKKNSAYQFQSDEYDVKKNEKLSQVTDNAVCNSAGDLDNFTRRIAIRVGQAATHEASIPEALQESKSNLWWYIGSAATVVVAGGVYYIVSHKKQNSANPSSLPLPPTFP